MVIISELYPGKTIGFSIWVVDNDSGDVNQYFLGPSGGTADGFVDGMLLGLGDEIPEDTAVESMTWGRIKASFDKEIP